MNVAAESCLFLEYHTSEGGKTLAERQGSFLLVLWISVFSFQVFITASFARCSTQFFLFHHVLLACFALPEGCITLRGWVFVTLQNCQFCPCSTFGNVWTSSSCIVPERAEGCPMHHHEVNGAERWHPTQSKGLPRRVTLRVDIFGNRH